MDNEKNELESMKTNTDESNKDIRVDSSQSDSMNARTSEQQDQSPTSFILVDHDEIQDEHKNIGDEQKEATTSTNSNVENNNVYAQTRFDQEKQTSQAREIPKQESQANEIPKMEHNTNKKKNKDTGFFRQHRSSLLVGSCLLLGGIGGFTGSYLAINYGSGSTNTVLYQSVDRSDSNGVEATNMSVKDIANLTMNSVVEITTESAASDQFMQQVVTQGAGSGVIISKDGYIVTNNHVVDGATNINVRTKDGTSYKAKLIGTDQKTDLAVIKIEAEDLSFVVMGSSGDLAVGDRAIAIGNPLGELGGTVTQGIISALDREINVEGQSMTLLQTDTAINHGNSGGGLFNDAGELIGIVNAKSSGSSVEGLGFAIPIDTAKPVIESLISNGYVTGRPQLGVSMINVDNETAAFQSGVNELGVYIAKVNDDSAADKAGLKVKDRMIKVDDQEITTSTQISKIIEGKKVGDSIKIVLERDGKEMSVTATLQEAINDTSKQVPQNQK